MPPKNFLSPNTRAMTLLAISAMICGCQPSTVTAQHEVKLPAPRFDSNVSIEHTLRARRSVRTFQNTPLSLADVSQLLWAAQGITDPAGFRTAPSAGALYPLEIYLVAGSVNGLASGVYKYRPNGHQLLRVSEGDKRARLTAAALHQSWVGEAPISIVFAAVYERSARKYGPRAPRYTLIEVGHAAQNVCLQAVALGLGSVPIGAFDDAEVKKICEMQPDEQAIYILPVGKPR